MLYRKQIDQLVQNQSQCDALCGVERKKLETELTQFVQYINLDMSSKSPSSNELGNVFASLTSIVRENCPLLFDMLDAILVHKNDRRKVSETCVKSAV